MNQLCKVCGEPAAGFHFGAFTCEGCKSFFGRTYNNVTGVSECKNGGHCEINKKNRTSCKSCRLHKCLSVGMSKSGSRYGRRSNWFKIHCLLSAQNQNGMSSSPEANNNNSSVTNNNSDDTNSNSANGGKHISSSKGLPSTLPSMSSLGGHSNDIDRTPSSSASRLINGAPPFPSLVGLSPESREQFLSSLNRNMGNPELCDYFRGSSRSNKSFYPEEGAEDMSRRSPGSLESPNSEASLDDKSNTPLFTMPAGSLDIKPHDMSTFDLLTRDLMKLGYDPLRLWPAMLTAPQNLHSFNPYRFMFPNFPAAAAFPPALPPQLVAHPFHGPNGDAKAIASAAAAAAVAENLTLPLSFLNNNNNSEHQSSPANLVKRRFNNAIVPPSSSLTLTPPISHHGSDDPPSKKFNPMPVQDIPIDLSASSNNNHVDDLVRVKAERNSSDVDDEDNYDSDQDINQEEYIGVKSECGDSDEEGSVLSRRNSRSQSRSSCSPKRERVSTPLDLTRTTNKHNTSQPKLQHKMSLTL